MCFGFLELNKLLSVQRRIENNSWAAAACNSARFTTKKVKSYEKYTTLKKAK